MFSVFLLEVFARQFRPRDCSDVKRQFGGRISSIYIVPIDVTKGPTPVFCDMTTQAGGWTVRSMFSLYRINVC